MCPKLTYMVISMCNMFWTFLLILPLLTIYKTISTFYNNKAVYIFVKDKTTSCKIVYMCLAQIAENYMYVESNACPYLEEEFFYASVNFKISLQLNLLKDVRTSLYLCQCCCREHSLFSELRISIWFISFTDMI